MVARALTTAGAQPLPFGAASRAPIAGSGRAALGLVAAALALAGGCVRHTATIAPPTPQAAAVDEPDRIPLAHVIVVTTPLASVTSPDVRRSGLPLDLPVTAWRRDADYRISRYDGDLQTPTPWWQRFPIDAVADAWPWTPPCAARLSVVLRPVPAMDPRALTAAAIAAGYGGAPPSRSGPAPHSVPSAPSSPGHGP